MKEHSTRRRFLGTSVAAAGGSGFGLGWGPGFLAGLPRVSAAEAALDPGRIVRLRPEMEPLVRFLEDTPRDRVIEELAVRIKGGLSYREVVAALLLAGVRNVEPRPAVGFKFHAVLVVHSAHLASVSGPDSDRWLPILWAVDDFKKSQARDVEEGDWTMAPVKEDRVSSPERARAAFVEAMDRWDEEAADAAVAGLARCAGAQEIFELFAPYAARDLRSIGHKAIFLANGWRTLQVMGWEHAESVLRSLAYALLNHRGDPNPAENDLDQDRPWRHTEKLAAGLRRDWQTGRVDAGATSDLMAACRSGAPTEASDRAAALLNDGLAPQAVIDALFTGAAELMLRQPNIPALHAVTTTNAMHFLYRTCGDDAIRRRVLLQNAAFLPMFRQVMGGRGDIGGVRLDTLEGDGGAGEGNEARERSAATVIAGNRDRIEVARDVIGFATEPDRARALMDEVRRRIFLKGTDAHHYKFSAAVLEDYFQVSPEWRGRFLACSTQYLPSGRDNPLVGRIRAALG